MMSQETRDTLLIVITATSLLTIMLLGAIGGLVSGIIEILKRQK